jgi:hypothetical protein
MALAMIVDDIITKLCGTLLVLFPLSHSKKAMCAAAIRRASIDD